MPLEIESKSWLSLAVLGALVSTLGSLLGVYLKEFLFSRSIEKFKQKQALDAVYRRYCDPLRLAAIELAHRLVEISDHYPTVFLTKAVLDSRASTQVHNTNEDPYYRRYKLLSTLYRLAAFLGWLELYRQEITHLSPGGTDKSRALNTAIYQIREDFADGHLNPAKDFAEWRDVLVFREELRAIGESMIEARSQSRAIIGYGRFLELFEAQGESPTKRWGLTLLHFFLDLETGGRDFRRTRLQRLVVHLVELLIVIDESSVSEALIKAKDKWKGTLSPEKAVSHLISSYGPRN